MKKIFLLMVLLSSILWASGIPTARFCVNSISERESDFFVRISALNNVSPSAKWKLLDSLPCGRIFWENTLSLNLGGRRISLTESVDNCYEKFSCKFCADDKRLQKNPTPKPRLGELSDYIFKKYNETELEMTKSFFEKFYGKKIKGTWEGFYSCYCPNYGTPKWETSLNVVIEGMCPPKKVKVVENDSSKVEMTDDDDEGVFVELGSSLRDDAREEEKPSRPDSAIAKGLFPCYYYYDEDRNSIEHYGSTALMNMVGKPEGAVESLECYDINGERVLVFGTNIPAEVYFDSRLKGEYSDGSCSEYAPDSGKLVLRRSNYYFCADRYSSSPQGCKAMEHGMDIVVDGNLKFKGWNRKDLWRYIESADADDVWEFLYTLRRYSNEKYLLPRNVSMQTLMAVGDEAARKTAGMAFYKRSKKVKYEKYDRNHFLSLKEAMNSCKNFKFESFGK